MACIREQRSHNDVPTPPSKPKDGDVVRKRHSAWGKTQETGEEERVNQVPSTHTWIETLKLSTGRASTGFERDLKSSSLGSNGNNSRDCQPQLLTRLFLLLPH